MKVRLSVLLLGIFLIAMALLERRPIMSGSRSASVVSDEAVNSPTIESSSESCLVLPEVTMASDGPSENGTEEEGWIPATVSWTHASLMRIARLQNADGSWGADFQKLGDCWLDRTGQTGLALVAFRSMGYSHLSRDEYGDVRFGETVKRGLKWLLAVQSEDGTLRSGGEQDLNHILGTLALSEAYGMSATQLFKDPAQRAVEALSSRFSTLSGWGSETMAAWAALAISSARESELEVGESFIWLNQQFLGDAAAPGNRPFATTAWALLQEGRFVTQVNPAAELLIRQTPEVVDPERALFDSILMMRGRNPVNPYEDEGTRPWIRAVWMRGQLELSRENTPPGEHLVGMSLLLFTLGTLWGR